jgi:hypothetical protein
VRRGVDFLGIETSSISVTKPGLYPQRPALYCLFYLGIIADFASCAHVY